MRFKILLVAITSFLFPCEEIDSGKAQEVKIIWLKLLQKYGYPHRGMRAPKVCVDNKAFEQIPRGAYLRAVYDKKNHVIYLRSWVKDALRHELAHAYLYLRYPRLPYALSENLSRCLYEPYVLPKEPPANLQRFLKANPSPFCISRKAAFYLVSLSEKEILKLLK